MADDVVNRDRLQPALLDRLTDHSPHDRNIEAPEMRTLTRAKLRQLVLRDLTWLLNAPRCFTEDEQARYPSLRSSTLNYGIVPLAGKLASRVELHELENLIRQAIVDFEPRILPDQLVVKGIVSETLLETHNVVSFQISGRLWAQPYPIELLLKTDVDLESGAARVVEASTTARIDG